MFQGVICGKHGSQPVRHGRCLACQFDELAEARAGERTPEQTLHDRLRAKIDSMSNEQLAALLRAIERIEKVDEGYWAEQEKKP